MFTVKKTKNIYYIKILHINRGKTSLLLKRAIKYRFNGLHALDDVQNRVCFRTFYKKMKQHTDSIYLIVQKITKNSFEKQCRFNNNVWDKHSYGDEMSFKLGALKLGAIRRNKLVFWKMNDEHFAN